jgi:hypothetical protein
MGLAESSVVPLWHSTGVVAFAAECRSPRCGRGIDVYASTDMTWPMIDFDVGAAAVRSNLLSYAAPGV